MPACEAQITQGQSAALDLPCIMPLASYYKKHLTQASDNARPAGLSQAVPSVDSSRTFSLAAWERVVTPWMFPMSPNALHASINLLSAPAAFLQVVVGCIALLFTSSCCSLLLPLLLSRP